MLFNSYEFLFGYLPVTFAVFFLLGRFSRLAAMSWLAVMSLAFYAWWSTAYVLLLVLSIGFNFVVGRAINAAHQAGLVKRAKLLLTFGIATDLAVLGYFKYVNFFISNADLLLHTHWAAADIVLPLGISFFTFTQIAFLVDAARGEAKVKEFTPYLLFVSYFPHLLAGPIIHHKQVMPQFSLPSTYRISARNVALGLSIFVIGLAKKVLIADQVAPVARFLFSSDADPNFSLAWVGVLAYTLQIYFDFSGYSDMAIGLSRLFGVELPLNFNSPYKAVSIIDFWRRWHMTLSAFLRDYLYIALGGNRKGKLRRYVNLLSTMLLGGLWHGAGWTFVVWGGLHGLYLVVNHFWRVLVPNRPEGAWWYRLICIAITFLAVVLAWVYFRAPDIATAFRIQAGLIGVNGLGLDLPSIMLALKQGVPYGYSNTIFIPIGLALAWFFPNTQEIVRWKFDAVGTTRWLETVRGELRSMLAMRWQPGILNGILIALVLFFCLTQLRHVSEFIYYQF